MQISSIFKRFSARSVLTVTAFTTSLLFTNISSAATPLKIGYSDWPGWVAWQVAIDKGWFKEAGVDVQFEWFDYVASMDAFAAGKRGKKQIYQGD